MDFVEPGYRIIPDMVGIAPLKKTSVTWCYQAPGFSPATFQPPNSRPPASSIGHAAASFQLSLPHYSTSEMSATIQTPLLSPPVISPSTQAPHRRRQAQSQARTVRDDAVIGHVLIDNKKFKCVDPGCDELTFGRLADLRRHYDQQHAKHRVQYYCPYSGCQRSHASTGGKGKSFGTRKDKRDEHVRKVHKKEQKNDEDLSDATVGSF